MIKTIFNYFWEEEKFITIYKKNLKVKIYYIQYAVKVAIILKNIKVKLNLIGRMAW